MVDGWWSATATTSLVRGPPQPVPCRCGAGVVPVRAPGVNDTRTDVETGERKRFASAILPAWARKSPQVAEVLPLLYLHGLSSDDFARSHCGLRSITMRVTVVTVAASEAVTVLALRVSSERARALPHGHSEGIDNV